MNEDEQLLSIALHREYDGAVVSEALHKRIDHVLDKQAIHAPLLADENAILSKPANKHSGRSWLATAAVVVAVAALAVTAASVPHTSSTTPALRTAVAHDTTRSQVGALPRTTEPPAINPTHSGAPRVVTWYQPGCDDIVDAAKFGTSPLGIELERSTNSSGYRVNVTNHDTEVLTGGTNYYVWIIKDGRVISYKTNNLLKKLPDVSLPQAAGPI